MMDAAEIASRVGAALEANDTRRAWRLLRRNEALVPTSPRLAKALLQAQAMAPQQDATPLLRRILGAFPDEGWLTYLTALVLLEPIDRRQPDEARALDDPALVVIAPLAAALARLDDGARVDPETAGVMWNTLGNACRHAGPEHDALALEAYARALALDPRPGWRFNLGLLYKHRGRWDDGAALFARLVDDRLVAGGGRDEAELWNLGICATGARRGDLALRAWKLLGMKPSRGEDGLPRVEKLAQVKVRLSTRTHARPGEDCVFEHVWAQPISPCHGEVLNPTMEEVGADIGDLVIWDGRPIGRWRNGSREGDRFPALGRLATGAWHTFPFRARGALRGELEAAGKALGHECGLYVFADRIASPCAACIQTGGPHHAVHHHGQAPPRIAEGKLLICPRTTRLEDARVALQASLRRYPHITLAVPAFHRALGDEIGERSHQALWTELA